jgi:sucrose phosphorylase
MMTQTIHEHLKFLYGEEKGGEIYPLLMQRIDSTRKHISLASSGELFSEKDIALITYGGSLRQNGQAPLQTLNEFLQSRLKGLMSTIHILPFFPYSSDDGFSVIDYESVNPELGAWDDVETIGQHFKLMFDAVINHMSAQSNWFRQFLADNPEFDNWFITLPPDTDLSSVTRPRVSPLLTPFEKSSGETVHVWTTFSADQVDLNYANPATLLRILDVLFFYLEKGTRVIRLDAIAYLWKKVGTSSIHLPETHRVVQLMHDVLAEVVPDVVIITETNVPHAENVSYFGDGYNEAQMVYNFTLPPLLFYSMITQNTDKLRDWINSLQTPTEQTTFFNFTASHDGIGVRPVEGILTRDELQQLISQVEARDGRVSYKTNPDGGQSPYELNITYVDAVTSPELPVETQVAQFIVSQAVMLALAGVPAIYIHSLLGSHNDTEGVKKLGYNRAINREKLNVQQVNSAIDRPDSFRAQVFERYTHLLRVRREQPAFHPNASQRALDVDNAQVLVLERHASSQQRILAINNLSGNQHMIDLSQADFKQGVDLLSGQTIEGSSIELPPYAVMWLETQA